LPGNGKRRKRNACKTGVGGKNGETAIQKIFDKLPVPRIEGGSAGTKSQPAGVKSNPADRQSIPADKQSIPAGKISDPAGRKSIPADRKIHLAG